MKEQKITVTNKAQLLTAFKCAFDCPQDTCIILVRKQGKTEYIIHQDRYSYCRPNAVLRKAVAKLRKIPAECFR